VSSVIAILPGLAVGVLIWLVLMRPGQLNEHERRRRRYGLAPKRRLPEDP
jgi:hypothetical protein